MQHIVPHDLDAATARRVDERAFEAYAQKFSDYEPAIRWASPTKAVITFRARGIALTGSMELVDKAVAIELDVPFLLRPFRGVAIEVIDREIRKWVAKAKEGAV
jgi:hypothetical protein